MSDPIPMTDDELLKCEAARQQLDPAANILVGRLLATIRKDREALARAVDNAKDRVGGFWTVLEKKEVHDRGDHQLVLVCERNGRRREAVVSGATWLKVEIGGPVELTAER